MEKEGEEEAKQEQSDEDKHDDVLANKGLSNWSQRCPRIEP